MADTNTNSAIVWRRAACNIQTSKQHFQKWRVGEDSVHSILEYTAADGKTYRTKFYNLDAILSVGYRVNSINATMFRKWANNVLKDYLLKGYSVNQRFERLEQRVSKTEEKIDFFVRTALPSVEGIFFDGQIFDAYTFVSDLVRSAKSRIRKTEKLFASIIEKLVYLQINWVILR